jgi:hypothetical protein
MFKTFTRDDAFLVLDIEFVDCEVLYAKYRRIDPRPAERRWPLRKVVAVSVMTLIIDGVCLEPTSFKSFSGADEGKLLAELFAYMRERGDHRLVTWAGCSADVPILRSGAMANGLKLPPQLVGNRRFRNGEHEHLDLAIVIKGAAAYAHLSELAVRFDLPVKMSGSTMAIPDLVSRGEFRRLEWLAESDTISTGLVLAAYLASSGEVASAEAAQHAIIKFVRPLRGKAPYANYLGNVQQRLREQMTRELQLWMARAV